MTKYILVVITTAVLGSGCATARVCGYRGVTEFARCMCEADAMRADLPRSVCDSKRVAYYEKAVNHAAHVGAQAAGLEAR